MPNDMYTINALAKELSDALVGGRIEKINQPEKDEVVFYVHLLGQTKILVVSVNANSPRIHVSNEKKDNPYIAPPFLMHLRRRFMGAKIERFSCVGYDRVIEIDVKAKNEMSDEVTNKIYVELLGRYSNVIVCDEDNTISEALRHITPENSLRCIMPKVKYELPPMNKIAPDSPKVRDSLSTFTGGDLAKFLASNIAGFSMATACELVSRANIDPYPCTLTPDMIDRLTNLLTVFFNVNSSELYSPCVRFENGFAIDYYFMPYLTLSQEYTEVSSLNEAVRLCSTEKDRIARLQNEGKVLNSAVKNAIKKAERNLETAKQKLKDCESLDELRIFGELITNNIYLLKKGDAKLVTLNYYTNEEITIPLDKTMTPQQNAQSYFKKYSKQKRTVVVCEKQKTELMQTLDYLYSLRTALDLAENAQELQEIKEELVSYGLIKEKQQKGKVRKPKQLPPKEYEVDGFKLIRGRNNQENERVTFGYAQENDLWFHTKDSHGSHLIIKTNGKKPSDEVIKTACEIAAFYSEKQQSGNTVVDYTLKKNVKKRPNAPKGAVIYVNYESAVVQPNAHKDKEVKTQ